jgi:uncharacterized cupin superfamily protein
MKTVIIITGQGTIQGPEEKPVEFNAGDCLLISAAYEGAMRFAEDTEYLTITI